MVKDGYKITDIGIIPEDWKIFRIKDVCSLINGRGFKPYEWEKDGLPIIRIQNLNGSDEFNYFKGHYDKKIEVEKDQLLFAWSGSKGTSFGPHIWKGSKGLLNYHTWKVDVKKDKINVEFFLHKLKKLTKSIEDKAHGASALVHTQKSEMEEFSFPFPSKELEQKKIAKALSDTDELIDSLQNLIEKKENIKLGTMQQLLTGKKRIKGFTEEWEEKELSEFATFYKGKGLAKSQIVDNAKYKCIHYGELFTKYKEVIKEVNSLTNEKTDMFISKENDVLMPTSDVTPNGLATASCITESNIILGGDILVIRLNDELDGSFLAYTISINKSQILQLVTGSTVYHLYGSDMARYRVKVPRTLEEQEEIVKILFDMAEEIESLKAKLKKTKAVKEAMMDELLTGKTRLL